MTIIRNDEYTNFDEASADFKLAINLDPNFARPYAGLLELSHCETRGGVPLFTPDDFRNFARRLEQLAPGSPATYCAHSIVNWNDRHYAEATNDALAAIKVDPNYEFGHTWYAWLLLRFGWPEEARKQMGISEKLTPKNAVIYRTLGDIYYAEGDYSKAIAQYQMAVRPPPYSAGARREIGWAFQAMGDYTNALNNFELANGPDDGLRKALARGIPSFWEQLQARTENNTNTELYWKAAIQIHLGNTNSALGWLERSFNTPEQTGMGIVSETDFAFPLGELLLSKQWEELHDNRRFKKLLEDIGFAKVMPQPKK